ncbi:MAG: hypothetical protein ACRBG0_22690 [Lewinella sp.]|jgi:hypothetical protein|uniref:hypothetical protein n=1 Tax=Lewinella sp. TaxID=2004506 RepID=UPI003D6C1C81
MTRFLIIVLISLFFLNQEEHSTIPPFIFPELDQAASLLWLAAEEQSPEAVKIARQNLAQEWQQNRDEVLDFPITAYNPYLLAGTLDGMIQEMSKAEARKDYSELLELSDRFLWEFQTIREFHRQNFYPLDLWWEVQAIFQEVHAATDDPQLGLLEWQELECLFDEMVCHLADYENRAENYLTQFAPEVDEDAHKAAMNQVYQCIGDYQSALASGYQERLTWPCDQLNDGLKAVLRCYLPTDPLQL